ncbi:MAG: hypothetical protein RLZZ628_3865 [Bacteroidota bacterium]|jgi:hypothetical protein
MFAVNFSINKLGIKFMEIVINRTKVRHPFNICNYNLSLYVQNALLFKTNLSFDC